MAVMLRSGLRVNAAGQGLFRLLAYLGQTAYDTAILLTAHEFDITRAALAYGLARRCPRCAKAKGQEALRGCNGCVATIRQRVHRMQDRVEEKLGGSAPRTRHRRPTLMFGADREVEGRTNVYDRVAAEGPGDVEF